MSELSKLKYSRLRDFFENDIFMRLSRKKDPLEFLLTMDKADSVQALVSAYNDIYIWLASIMLNEIPELLLKKWWQTYRLDLNEEYYLFNDLSQCFNENLLRLFKEIPEPTKDDVIYYLANLRVGSNVQHIQDKIINITRVDKKDVSFITIARDGHYQIRRKIEKSEIVYKYRDVDLYRFKTDYKVLASNKRIFDVAENKFAEENGMSYEKIMAEFERDEEISKLVQSYKEEEERKEEKNRKWLENKRQEAKENRKILFKIIAIMTPFMVAGIALLCYLEKKYPTQFEQAEKIGKIVGLIFVLGLYIYIIKDDIIERLKKKS